MATMENNNIKVAIEKVLAKTQSVTGISALKAEQYSALKAFIGGGDVLGVLPTGFGKSLIYQLAPLVLEEIGRTGAIVMVVSPLNALMEDQRKEAAKLGIGALQLGVSREDDILNGRCSLVFGSPEKWLLSEKWRQMLDSDVYRSRLFGIVVDEVHVAYKWGEGSNGKPAFRESFGRLGELRSLTKSGTPVLALTASADLESQHRVMKILNMERATQVTVRPSRDNIRLGLMQVPTSNLKCLDWVVKEVLDKGQSMSPVLIYCRTLKVVGKVFGYLKAQLGARAWVNSEQKNDNLLVGMYHCKTLEKNKSRVVSSLNGNGNCRVVVATTALGMGLNFPDISHVVMYGAPEDAEAIVQQIGRAGRSGAQAHAVIYVSTKYTNLVDKTVREIVKTDAQMCFRKTLYGFFENNPANIEPGHLCCTYCHSKCTCESVICAEPIPNYEALKEAVPKPAKCRQVEADDRVMIKDMLEDYMANLVPDTAQLFTDIAACTGFSTELIKSVVNNCEYIFDLDYIMENLPVFRSQHAIQILHVISEVFDDIDRVEPSLPEESFSEPDLDFMGYFDEDDGSETSSVHSSGSDA